MYLITIFGGATLRVTFEPAGLIESPITVISQLLPVTYTAAISAHFPGAILSQAINVNYPPSLPAHQPFLTL